MRPHVSARSPAALLRVTPEASALLLIGAAAWALVVWLASSMGSMPGTMGLGLPAFVGVWALMMAAMMLPAVAPVAAAYTRSFTNNRGRRCVLFAGGYLLVWAGSGLPAYGAAVLVDRVASLGVVAGRSIAAGTLVAVAVYQLTPLKRVCLEHCRSPLGQLLRFASVRGFARELRVGLRHGAFCAGCCWLLMLVLVALGTMNIFLMIGLAAVVVLEKYSPHGEILARAVAAAAIALAVVTLLVPQTGLGTTAMQS